MIKSCFLKVQSDLIIIIVIIKNNLQPKIITGNNDFLDLTFIK